MNARRESGEGRQTRPASALPQELRGPSLRGHRVSLQPVRAQDYEMLRMLELSEDLVPIWRHQGATPSPERWVESLWTGVLAQFIVVDIARKHPLGIVNVYSADFRHGHAYIAASKFDLQRRSTLFLEGFALFVDYVFAVWNFRKLYMETSERNIGQFASAIGPILCEEGRLREHLFFDGRYWDVLHLALYRNTWDEIRTKSPVWI